VDDTQHDPDFPKFGSVASNYSLRLPSLHNCLPCSLIKTRAIRNGAGTGFWIAGVLTLSGECPAVTSIRPTQPVSPMVREMIRQIRRTVRNMLTSVLYHTARSISMTTYVVTDCGTSTRYKYDFQSSSGLLFSELQQPRLRLLSTYCISYTTVRIIAYRTSSSGTILPYVRLDGTLLWYI
jgi:hypothetical protein